MSNDNNLISIRDAADKGITKLRNHVWALKGDHIEIGIHEKTGSFLPWVKMYSEMNENINGRNPVNLLIIHFDLDKKEYEEYK